MRDVDDPDTAVLQLRDDLEQLLRFSLGERARRLVEDQHAHVARKGAGDFDHLLLSHAQIPHPGLRPNPQADPLQELGRAAPDGGPVNPPTPTRPRRQVAEEDVLTHTEGIDEAQLLVDGDDAQVLRRARVLDGHRLAIDANGAPIGAVSPGEDLHQRRFSGAILADDRVNFAWSYCQRDIVQGMNAWKTLIDVFGLQDRLSGYCHDSST